MSPDPESSWLTRTVRVTPTEAHGGWDVFVSYSRVDEQIAVALVHQLISTYGLNVWIDLERLVAGGEWREDLRAALDESRLVMVIESQFSVRSAEVEWECGVARHRGTPVLACVIDDHTRPEWLADAPVVDLRADPFDGNRLATLSAPHRAALDTPGRQVPPYVAIRHRFLRRGITLYWLGALVIFLACGAMKAAFAEVTRDNVRDAVLAFVLFGSLSGVLAAIHGYRLIRRRSRYAWMGYVSATIPVLVAIGGLILLGEITVGMLRESRAGAAFHLLDWLQSNATVVLVGLIVLAFASDWIKPNVREHSTTSALRRPGVVGRVGRRCLEIAAHTKSRSARIRGAIEMRAESVWEGLRASIAYGDSDAIQAWLPSFLPRRRVWKRHIRRTRPLELVTSASGEFGVRHHRFDAPIAEWIMEALSNDDSNDKGDPVPMSGTFFVASRFSRRAALSAIAAGPDLLIVTLGDADWWAATSTHQFVDGSHLDLPALREQVRAAGSGQPLQTTDLDRRRRWLALPRKVATNLGLTIVVTLVALMIVDDAAMVPAFLALPIAFGLVAARRAPIRLMRIAVLAYPLVLLAAALDPLGWPYNESGDARWDAILVLGALYITAVVVAARHAWRAESQNKPGTFFTEELLLWAPRMSVPIIWLVLLGGILTSSVVMLVERRVSG